MAETNPNQKTADLSSLPDMTGSETRSSAGAHFHQDHVDPTVTTPPVIENEPYEEQAPAYHMTVPPVIGEADEPVAPAPAEPAFARTIPPVIGGADSEMPVSAAPASATGTITAPPVIPQVDPKPRGANQGTPVISLRNVSKIYPAQPNKPALSEVNIDVYAGEFVFLVGHSGSGKSTFIRMLTREIKPTTGTVRVAGQDLTSMRDWKVPYLRRNIGCVFQDFKLLPKKTAYENVAFALECIGKSKHVIRTQVPEVLRLVGLEEKMDALPDELSGGEQQRVSVARAFVNRPPLLVCDEPTGNLDPAISLGIMKLLERINRTGTTVVVATHDREMVDSMRRRVVALENGHIVRDEENGGYGCYGAI